MKAINLSQRQMGLHMVHCAGTSTPRSTLYSANSECNGRNIIIYMIDNYIYTYIINNCGYNTTVINNQVLMVILRAIIASLNLNSPRC